MADQEEEEAICGGIHDVDLNTNNYQLESVARFAVHEHNKKENVTLGYKRLLSAKTQVVAGVIYYLTVEVTDGETKKVYEAKVYERPWENLIQLTSFDHLRDVQSDT